MGAEAFVTFAKGKTAQEAFDAAREQAQYDYGHRGYTGTIAEKHAFTMIAPPAPGLSTLEAAEEWAWKLINDGDARVDDKWGPAGCVEVNDAKAVNGKKRLFCFFGWASS